MPPATPILTFLTEDPDLREIATAYWDLAGPNAFSFTVDDIAAMYARTSAQVQQITAKYCNACSRYLSCGECGTPYRFKNRADFMKLHRASPYRCEECKVKALRQAQEIQSQKEQQQRAYLRAEQEAQAQKEQQQREYLLKHYSLARCYHIPVLDMNVREATFLLSLLRTRASENFDYIFPLDAARPPLTPADRNNLELVKFLHDCEIIKPHPGSRLAGFVWDNGQAGRFYLDRVHWGWPAAMEHPSLREAYNELEEWVESWPHSASDWAGALDVAVEVARWECLEYLTHSLEKHNLPFEPGPKTLDVISYVLRHFSVGQAFSFIWRSAVNAAGFYVRGQGSRHHAANTVVGSLQRTAERALAEGWQVSPYRRSPECPQSMVSQVMFGGLLGLGERYLEKPLSTLFSGSETTSGSTIAS